MRRSFSAGSVRGATGLRVSTRSESVGRALVLLGSCDVDWATDLATFCGVAACGLSGMELCAVSAVVWRAVLTGLAAVLAERVCWFSGVLVDRAGMLFDNCRSSCTVSGFFDVFMGRDSLGSGVFGLLCGALFTNLRVGGCCC